MRRVPDVTDALAQLTIDGLAQRTGMTVRNIRAHQSRGLLPPPDVRGRTGFYGPEHVARIELIQEMQGEGFNLEAIRRLVDATSTEGDEPLRFLRAVHEPYVDTEPEVVTLQDLADRWGTNDPQALRRALKLGFLRPLGDGKFEDLSPGLGRAAEQLGALGVPAEVQLELAGKVRDHAGSVARAYVRLFVEWVWKPFQDAGAPAERWPEVLEALERLRPLAGDSLTAIFGVTMAEATEEAFGREIAKLQQRGGGGRRRAQQQQRRRR